MMNRGGRGWESSGHILSGSDEIIRQQQEALARIRKQREARAAGGGRGWEPPIVDYDEVVRRQSDKARRDQDALHGIAMGPARQQHPLVAELRQRQAAAGIVDLVQHNGVWMSPEDAARG